MSREEERKRAAEALSRLLGGRAPAPAEPPAPAPIPPRTATPPAKRPAPSAPPARLPAKPAAAPSASRKTKRPRKKLHELEGAAAKRAEALALRARRERELGAAAAPVRQEDAAPVSSARQGRPRIDPRFEGRRAKQAEAQALKDRRAGEVARASNLQWRGMSRDDHIPQSIRRTAWVRTEPNVQEKIRDVLGDPREKEGRVKNRERGRRQ